MTVSRIFRETFRISNKNYIVFNRTCTQRLAKIVLIPLGLTAASTATDAAIIECFSLVIQH